MKYPSWKGFESKYPDYQEIAFEALARMLFRCRYKLGDSLPYFKNHAGNETGTIVVDGEEIGFQAKYFDNEINAALIENSINIAHNKHPNQSKMIVYTNLEFGNPRKKGETKTEKQRNIEQVAKSCNIQLEWMYGDNILDAVLKNELAYDVFFNIESNLQYIREDLAAYNDSQLDYIKNQININGKAYKFDRSVATNRLMALIPGNNNVMLSGESGSGKSAILKEYYEQYKDNRDYVFFIINTGQLNQVDLNSLFHLHHDYVFAEFYGYFAEVKNKILVLDSAEQLLDLNNRRVALMLVGKLKREGWNFIVTCKTNSQEDLISMLKEDFQLDFILQPVDALQDYELKKFEEETGIRLPLNDKLRHQLSLPFYLARYCEVGEADGNEKAFRERVWKQKVRGTSSIGRKIEACLFEIIRRKQTTGLFVIPIDGLDVNSLDSLIKEDIIGEIEHRGVFVKHDLYSDWALDYMLLSELIDTASIESKLVSKPTISYANAFRRWFTEKVNNKEDVVDVIISVMFEKNIDDRWKNTILEVVGSSYIYASVFISKYKTRLAEDDYCWFNTFANTVSVSCHTVTQYLPYKNGIRIPISNSVGSGWEAVISFIDNNKEDYYINNLSVVYNILNGYLNKQEKTNGIVKVAGLLALRLFDIQANPQNKNLYFWQINMKDWAALVCRYAIYIQDEMKSILAEVVKNSWIHHNSPYHDIVEYLITPQNVLLDINAYFVCRKQLLPILKLFWSESKDNYKDYSSIGTEKYFGLNPERSGMNYFPPSPFQTPILGLLNIESLASLDDYATLDFVIEFVDVCISCFDKRGKELQKLDEITVSFDDGSKHKVLCSSMLWNMYRGSSGISVPNILESIHMALEKYLLDLLEGEEKNKNIEGVRMILWRILKNSHSASLYAIVTSVVLAHYNDMFDLFLFLIQDIRFLQLDLHRQISEYHIASMSFVYMRHKDYATERKKSADMKHRKLHLENLLTYLQITYDNSTKDEDKKRLNQLYSCVDKLLNNYKSTKNDATSDEPYIIERINVRKWTKSTVIMDNGIEAIQYEPVFPEHLVKDRDLIQKASDEAMFGLNIAVWADKMLRDDIDSARMYQFHDKPKEILKVIADVEESLKKNQTIMGLSMGREYVPYIGSAALLIYYREKMSQEEIELCSQRVIDALQNPDFLLSGMMTGFDTILEVIPILIELYPNEQDTIADIILTYAKRRKEIGNFRSCDRIRQLIVKHNLWDRQADFMQYVQMRFYGGLNLSRIEEITLNDAETMLSLLTESPKDREIANKCLIRLSDHWKNTGLDYMDYDNQMYDSDLVAAYLMNTPENEIQQLASVFGDCMAKKQSHESILSSILIDCIYTKRYEQFWRIWYAFFPSLVKNAILLDSSTKMDYLLCPSFLRESSNDWFHFEEENVEFFERVINQVDYDDDVLFCVLKVFDTIAEKYQIKAIPLVYRLTRRELTSWNRNKRVIISYMDMYVDSLNINHRSDIICDKNLYDQYCAVLDYMVKNQSETASRILKTL